MIRIYDMRSGQVTPVGDEAAAADMDRVCPLGELPQLQPVTATPPSRPITPDLAAADCERFLRSMWRR